MENYERLRYCPLLIRTVFPVRFHFNFDLKLLGHHTRPSDKGHLAWRLGLLCSCCFALFLLISSWDHSVTLLSFVFLLFFFYFSLFFWELSLSCFSFISFSRLLASYFLFSLQDFLLSMFFSYETPHLIFFVRPLA